MEKLKVLSCNLCDTDFQSFKAFSEHSFLCGLKQNVAKKEDVHIEQLETVEKRKENSRAKHKLNNSKRDKLIEPTKCSCTNCLQGLVGFKTDIHICDFCDKTFQRTDKLRAHVSTHTGIYLYKCKVCEREFSRSDKMKRHMLEQHSTKLPYKCEECLIEFGRSERFKKHMSNHCK